MVKKALHGRKEREEGKRERLGRKWDGREEKERDDSKQLALNRVILGI